MTFASCWSLHWFGAMKERAGEVPATRSAKRRANGP
jgi:hypothetical protein